MAALLNAFASVVVFFSLFALSSSEEVNGVKEAYGPGMLWVILGLLLGLLLGWLLVYYPCAEEGDGWYRSSGTGDAAEEAQNSMWAATEVSSEGVGEVMSDHGLKEGEGGMFDMRSG